MAFGSVTLVPGVNVERTPTLLRAGYATSSLIRFKDSLAQKLGGWQKYITASVPQVPRDMHAWEDLNQALHLAVGSTTALSVITSGTAADITPQTKTSDFAPNISTTSASPTVAVTDPNVANITAFDAVFFNVPVSQGGLILDGLYPVGTGGVATYRITAQTNATATTANPTQTNNTTAAADSTLHFASTPAWVKAGMVIFDLDTPAAIAANTIVSSVTATTVVMNKPVPGGQTVGNGDHIVFSSVPVFATTSATPVVNVTFIAHGRAVGDTVVFQIGTTGGGVTILGTYKVLSVVDVDNYTIQASAPASSSATFAMNGGKAEIVYYLNLGPPASGTGFGIGGFGMGGFGSGSAGTAQTGTKITATDWTSDNWGQIYIACPKGGGIYYWDPTGGFTNAGIISTGPVFNNGIFVSMSQQILVAYGSTVQQGVGYLQEPMLVQWTNVGDFFDWISTAQNQAGNFVIPTGSQIMGGMAATNQNLLWTDLDLWAMNYIGFPDVFGFNKIGAGAGLVSSHAAQQFRGSVYWMGRTNFYAYTSGGVSVLPCPVWDAVFQNLNTAFLQNIRAMPNTPFNEVGWLYPSAASVSGECDSYVKMNVTEPGQPWDYGPLPRSAWIDQTVLGMPIGATPAGVIYQHEMTNDADGQVLSASFTTGEVYLAEGEDFVVVDRVLPDFRWALFSGGASAQVQLTFNVTNYPGDTPVSYGPYTVTQATEYISVRFRGRLMSITVASNDIGSFWRLGSIKYRYQAGGRR